MRFSRTLDYQSWRDVPAWTKILFLFPDKRCSGDSDNSHFLDQNFRSICVQTLTWSCARVVCLQSACTSYQLPLPYLNHCCKKLHFLPVQSTVVSTSLQTTRRYAVVLFVSRQLCNYCHGTSNTTPLNQPTRHIVITHNQLLPWCIIIIISNSKTGLVW